MPVFVSHFSRVSSLVLTALSVFVAGCNYHGQIKRNLYQTTPFPQKISARVMVAADTFSQPHFVFKDYNLTSANSYTIDLKDGVAVAAADALNTLFTDVSVDEYKNRSQYDYTAELDYQVTQQDTYYRGWKADGRYLWMRIYWEPKFQTTLTLTLRNPHTNQVILRLSDEHASKRNFNTASYTLHWVNEATFHLLFPLVAPVYVQTAGNSLKETLQADLRTGLRHIMTELEENRLLFAPDHQNENFARQDRSFVPWLTKTVYLLAPDGSHGTGFFISQDGYLLTNAHVVEGYRDIRFYLYEDLPFEPGKMTGPFRYARVLAKNKSRDVALLKAEGKFDYFELDTDRTHYQTGKAVFVMGNPKNELWTVTTGIISALSNVNGVEMILTDASLNAGNSGGPLVSKETGKVLGINSLSYRKTEVNNIGFAISAFEALRTLGITLPIQAQNLEALFQQADENEPQKVGSLSQPSQNYVK